MPQNLADLLLQGHSLLNDLHHLGLHWLDGVAPPPSAVPAAASARASGSTERESLDQIRADLGDCQRCGLARQRHHLVFGCGDPAAALVLVGEGPGREEDLKGDPFVGEAGRLLDNILLAMGLQRSQVYICNVIKCRPPQNRNPQAEEIAACEPFLRRQLAAIRPQLIVALGKFAAQTLLRSQTPISQLRGHWQEYDGVPLMPTYHPAYLLRNPAGKREVWQDMKQVLQRLRQVAA